MHAQRETFLDGMTPLTLTRNTSHDKSHYVRVNEDFWLLAPYVQVQADWSHLKANGHTQSDYQEWSDSLTTRMLTSGMDERTRTSGVIFLAEVLPIRKRKAGNISFHQLYRHTKDETEQASQHRIQQYAASSVIRNANDICEQHNQAEAEIAYHRGLGKKWNLNTRAKYQHIDTKAHDYLYHPDSMALPSQLELLSLTTDPQNSYDYRYKHHQENIHLSIEKPTVRHYGPGVNLLLEGLCFNIDIPLQQQSLAYQRGAIDTLARRSTVYFNPSTSYKFWFGKDRRNEMRFAADFTTHELDLLQTIPYRDDSQPLVVNLGNAGLKARQSSSFSFDYASHNGPHKQEVNFNSRFDYNVRDISQSLSYNAATGVYTYQPVNVGGGYNLSGTLNYSRDLDKEHYWSVQSRANASLHHSVDHAMLTGDTESRLNAVNTLTVGGKAHIQYNKDALNIRATGDISWRHSEGRMLDFETLNALDCQYGLNGRYTLPRLKTTLSVEATMYSRRGYGSRELNTDDLVLNASLSQSLLKGRLIARIQAFDLLHQLSNTQYAVNAQGRTVTWYRSLPHYVMAHLVFHWNKNPKKK